MKNLFCNRSFSTSIRIDLNIRLCDLNLDYFEMSAPQQEEIINQLEKRKDLRGAIPFIIHCLKKEGQPQVSPTDENFHDVLGPGRFFLMLDETNKTEITVNKQKFCGIEKW